jgi:hypothetical protein
MGRLIDIKLNMEKLCWPLFMVLCGVVLICLKLFKFGIPTLVCGILCRFVDATHSYWLKKKFWKAWVIILQALFIIVWIFSLYREIY